MATDQSKTFLSSRLFFNPHLDVNLFLIRLHRFNRGHLAAEIAKDSFQNRCSELAEIVRSILNNLVSHPTHVVSFLLLFHFFAYNQQKKKAGETTAKGK